MVLVEEAVEAFVAVEVGLASDLAAAAHQEAADNHQDNRDTVALAELHLDGRSIRLVLAAVQARLVGSFVVVEGSVEMAWVLVQAAENKKHTLKSKITRLKLTKQKLALLTGNIC